jgi:SAM-dependent methyltransferase
MRELYAPYDRSMTAHERWLDAMWPRVGRHLPRPPAKVVDLGCGAGGGYVPMLRAGGYDAIGIDPEAPDEPWYVRSTFEAADVPRPVDAIVASTSLHHVEKPSEVIDRIAAALTSRGTLVVIEWRWEKFDTKTAEWCFQRLGSDEEAGWLHRRRDEWAASSEDWPTFIRGWANRERVHRGEELVRLLDERFERRHLDYGPYFFSDLAGTTEADEQAAIDARVVEPTRIDYIGTRSPT